MMSLRSLVGMAAFTTLGVGMLSRAVPGTTTTTKLLIFLSTDCPVAARYTSRLNALYDQYGTKGVQFLALFPNDLETKPGIETYMADRNYKFPYNLDLGAAQAKKVGATTIPSVVVEDAAGHVLYRGAIDDNQDTTLVRHSYLGEVLAATAAGDKPTVRSVTPVGCIIMPSEMPPPVSKVDYTHNVQQILNKHCIECHRPGEVAPFSLIGFENAKKWSPMIAQVTASRQMPPWKAVRGYGEFRYDNSLSETEIETLRRWAAAKTAKGSGAVVEPQLPPVREWALGTPDLIIKPAKAFRLEPDGEDIYRNYVIHTNFKTPVYVRAMDVKPGNRKVVHHAIIFVDGTGVSDRLVKTNDDGQEGYTSSGGGPGFFPETSLGGWVPGTRPRPTDPDYAFIVKPGANLVLQVHYHKDGKSEEDLTQAGLYFTAKPPKHILNLAWILNPAIRIPAGESEHVEHIKFNVHRDMTLHALLPHMHLLGKSMRARALLPDGTTVPLIFVKDWDFNWQISYILKEPVKLPNGSQVLVDAVYDNTVQNPKNPNNPPREVTWGEQTTDEMCVIAAAYTVDHADKP